MSELGPNPGAELAHELPAVPEESPDSSPELSRDREWQRLDPRMLLIHPVREVIRFLPALLALLVAGTAAGAELWQGLFVVVPVGLGLLRYLTTSFRIADGRVELRRGLLNRHVLSTPIDRVRTVDLTSSLIHRLLGLTKVRVGTGTASSSDDERLDLDGLPLLRARELRAELLRVGPVGRTIGSTIGSTVGATADGASSWPTAEPISPQVVVRLTPDWLRFAPFTGTGLVLAGAALGGLSQLLNVLGLWDNLDPSDVTQHRAAPPLMVLVPLAAIALLVLVSLLAIGGYVVTNWAFTLTRDTGTWHLSRGLFTTRETTLDDERVAGVSLSEPLGIRLARGASLSAIVTGLDRGQQGSSALVPPAPRRVVQAVARTVLGVAGPVDGTLLRHGPRATRRRWTRALAPALVVAAACVVLVAVAGAPTWLLLGLVVLPVAALLAADRARSLGHALVDGHVVSRSGSLVRRRRALAVEHVIGWNFQATWFQRRAGLTTLVATTAGGNQAVEFLDVPESEAVAFGQHAMPALVAQFRATAP